MATGFDLSARVAKGIATRLLDAASGS